MYCRWVRSDDRLPKAGCRELLVLCREYFGEKFNIGRDRFYDVLRSNGLMLRQKRYRVKTTFSHHHFRIYEDLLNTSPKFLATACGGDVRKAINAVEIPPMSATVTDSFTCRC